MDWYAKAAEMTQGERENADAVLIEVERGHISALDTIEGLQGIIDDLNAKLTAQQDEIDRLGSESERMAQEVETAAAAAHKTSLDFRDTAVSIAKHLTQVSITPERGHATLILSVVGRLLAMSAVFEGMAGDD